MRDIIRPALHHARARARGQKPIKRDWLSKYIHPENVNVAKWPGIGGAIGGAAIGALTARGKKDKDGIRRRPTAKDRLKRAAKGALVFGTTAAIGAGLENKLHRKNIAYHIRKRRNMLRKESIEQSVLDILNGASVADVVNETVYAHRGIAVRDYKAHGQLTNKQTDQLILNGKARGLMNQSTNFLRQAAKKNCPKSKKALDLVNKAMNTLDDVCEDEELTESPLAIFSAVSGLASVYDLIKSRGLKKDQEYVVNVIKNGKKVRSKEFVKKIDPTIHCLTNRNEIKRALSREPALSQFEVNVTTEVITDAITRGNNAFAMPGDKGMYIFVSKMCPADVIAHEIGHIIDFRRKGITISDWKEYDKGFGILMQWWKPTFKKTTLNAEQAAWDLAPGKATAERKKIEKAAIGTYEKSFHRQRGKRTGAIALMALINDMAHRFFSKAWINKKGRPRLGKK